MSNLAPWVLSRLLRDGETTGSTKFAHLLSSLLNGKKGPPSFEHAGCIIAWTMISAPASIRHLGEGRVNRAKSGVLKLD